jgi:hypothetical protein
VAIASAKVTNIPSMPALKIGVLTTVIPIIGFGFYIPEGEPRLVADNALIHESVLRRMEAVTQYRPTNVPSTHQIVPMATRAM